MTDERDPKLQSAYRALGAEEPPRALDEAILAAARRPVQPWMRRWAVPLSLAAVVVLSVTVTLRIQHEQPGMEQPAPVREKERVARKTAEPIKPATEPVASAPRQESITRKEAQAFPSSAQDRAVAENRVVAAAPPPAPVPAAAPRMEEAPALAKRADSGASSAAGQAAESVAESPAPAAAAPAMGAMKRDRAAAERTGTERAALTPEQELERIADLRKQGLHDEADRRLAEFRKRYPDFKLTEAMRERVERR